MTIVTVAHYRLPEDPDAAARLVADLAPIVAATRAEPGNRGIEVVRDSSDPHHLVLVERWADEEALAEHRRTSHFTEGIVGSIAPRLAGREVMIGRATGL